MHHFQAFWLYEFVDAGVVTVQTAQSELLGGQQQECLSEEHAGEQKEKQQGRQHLLCGYAMKGGQLKRLVELLT